MPQGYQKVFNRHYPHLLLTQHNLGYTLTDTDTKLVHYFRYEKTMDKAYRVAIEDYNGNHIRYHLNDNFQPHTIEHSDGIRLELYYEEGHLYKIHRADIDKAHKIAEYQQQSGYLTFVWSQGNTEQQIQYNAQGLLSRLTYHKKSQVEYWYNNEERCIETIGSEGYHHWRFHYDRENRITRAYDANQQCWQIHFDKDDQATKEIDPQGNTTEYSYDNYGLITKEKDPEGNETLYGYESWTGKPTSITDSLERTTQFIYDEDFENIQSIKDTSGVTQYHYDAKQNIEKITLPTGDTIQYQHDSHGNLGEIQIAGKLARKFHYDKNHRLTTTR